MGITVLLMAHGANNGANNSANNGAKVLSLVPQPFSLEMAVGLSGSSSS